MRISASVEYGARIMVQLARLNPGESISAEKLSSLENIPKSYVDQIVQRLRHARLVESVRGPHGGYVMARPAKEISVGMLMRAIEGHVFEDLCERFSSGDHQCRHTAGCDIRPMWQKLTRLVEDFLDRVTVADLLAEPKAACVVSRLAAAEEAFGRSGPSR